MKRLGRLRLTVAAIAMTTATLTPTLAAVGAPSSTPEPTLPSDASALSVLPAAAPKPLPKTAKGSSSVVKTVDGSLKGKVKSDYRVFKGVRYAAPVGRWKAPEPVRAWAGTKSAAKAGAECVQTATFWRQGFQASTKEDCLFMNIYTPKKKVSAKTLKPVLVYFHGGGDKNGSANDATPYRMSTWGDSIAITVNYRLGVMGNLYLPALDAESAGGRSGGNYANLDKIQALKWIQQNITAFGGNPKKVTIGGQSAGAEAVCWLLASPSAAGLFSGAALESALACGQGATKEQATATATKFATAAGCTDTGTLLGCLRSKTAAQLLDAQIAVGSRFLPTIGGTDMPVSTDTAFTTGRFNKVPVIIGHARDERRAFTYESYDLVSQPVTSLSYQAAVKTRYNTKADAVLAAYPVARFSHPGLALSAVRSDEWACGHLTYAQMLSKYVPTYAFEFSDATAPERPYVLIPPSFPIGAAHTSEVPYLWQSEIKGSLNAKQRKLSKLMIDYWTNFAAKGTPNAKGVAKWPAFTQTAESRLDLRAGGKTAVLAKTSYRAEHKCQVWLS